jgi:tetratricopeptide (TPR) repeat protein
MPSRAKTLAGKNQDHAAGRDLLLRAAQGLLLALALIFASLEVAGDVIVLKSGRRITAYDVREEGERIIAELDSGELTFSKAQVARVERGGAQPSGNKEIPLPVADLPSVSEGIAFDEIAGKLVVNDSIDRSLLGRIENDARAGSLAATTRAAAAHDMIGDFHVSRGELAEAIESYRRALVYAPRHLALQIKLASVMLRKQQYREASQLLETARGEHPGSPEVAALLGWAYYSSEKMKPAISEWERSLALRRDSNVEAALKKARREAQADADYDEADTSRFLLKYHGPAVSREFAREVLATLEQLYDEISSDLNLQLRESIIVFLYTQEAFQDVTRAPGWAGAINDGKLRLPIQGLNSMTPEFRRVLKHELTHSFIVQKTAGRCPVWLNEGLAQWEEGKSPSRFGVALAEQYAAGRFIPLRNLEGSFIGLDSATAALAYAESLAAVDYLVRSNGMSDLERLLERLPTAMGFEDAMRETLRLDYEELDDGLKKHLGEQFGSR